MQKDYTKTAVREIRIKSGDSELYGRVRGQGPMILCVHGVACDADYFENAAEYLSRQFTVITYDRRGYSRSASNIAKHFSLTLQAEDAACVLRDCMRFYCQQESGQERMTRTDEGDFSRDAAGNFNLATDETKEAGAFVVGSSAGCLVAAELARLYPSLVNGLFLHEPVFAGSAGMKVEIDKLRENLHEAAEKKHVIRGMRLFLDAMGGTDSCAVEMPMEKLAQNMKNLEQFLYLEMDDFLSYDLSQIKGIDVPLRIAVGKDDGSGLFHRAAVSAATALGCGLMYVPGYHNFPSDRPDEFALCVMRCYRKYRHVEN